MNKRLLLFFSVLLFSAQLGAVCTMTAKCTGGNWTSASTWTPSGCTGITIPTDNCIIIIPACATVTMDTNSTEYSNMEVYVYGTLDFDNGQKLNMCAGYIKVFTGGRLTGGTPGSKIDICGSTVWNGGTTTNGIVSFGGGTTLPVELIYFDTHACGTSVCAEWTTASEQNNNLFTLEKTRNGIDFESAGTLPGAGNSSSVLNYSLEDTNPYEGQSYYRLMQTDFNGDHSYSALSAVDVSAEAQFDFIVYPNPGNGNEILFNISAFPEGTLQIVVKDIAGKELFSQQIEAGGKKESVFSVFPPDRLSPGMYMITVTCGEKSYYRKLLVS